VIASTLPGGGALNADGHRDHSRYR